MEQMEFRPDTLVYEGQEFTLFWDGTHGKDPKCPSHDADLFSKVAFVKPTKFMELRVDVIRSQTARQATLAANMAKAYEVLLPDVPQTLIAIQARSGLSECTARTALRHLVKGGIVGRKQAEKPSANGTMVYWQA